MARSLHDAGIEVILDVVYNHTAEGNHLGPTLSFKGIDNDAYYRLVDDDRQYYMDYTGTGNSLNVRHPHSLQLIMDSLRYWVLEMHVDGFRFDLASAPACEFYDVDKLSTFFELVQQDPTISQVKLIAEPWDIGPGGYQVGNFPPQWTEWNGHYRDTVRDFWRGESATLGEFASRLTDRPTSTTMTAAGRWPRSTSSPPTTASRSPTSSPTTRSTTRPTARTTTTANDNRSWNCGVEGPTDDPAIQTLRPATAQLPRHVAAVAGRPDGAARRRARTHAARQQQHVRPGLRVVVGALGRRRHPVDRVRRLDRQAPQPTPDVPPGAFFDGRPVRRGEGEALPDIVWLTPAGEEMVPDDWDSGFGRATGLPQRPGDTRT